MTTQRDAYLEEVGHIRSELSRTLDGMDYCLDWKPSDEEWSAREVLYHLVDTPEGGIHTAVQGILEGSIGELTIASNLTNINEERRAKELGEVLDEANTVLDGLGQALSATADASLAEKRASVYSVARGVTEERTAQMMVERVFINHWREHLSQLTELREMLGVG